MISTLLSWTVQLWAIVSCSLKHDAFQMQEKYKMLTNEKLPKLPEDWELILNPSKSEHLPIGDTSNPVAYSLTSRTSPNAQPVQTVSSVRDLGLLFNTNFSADDNVARATKKARGMLFLSKAIFRCPDP